MNKYVVSKKHNSIKYVGISMVTATIVFSSPLSLSADNTVLGEVNVTDVNQNTQYSEAYKVNKSSSSKITQDLIDTPQTIQIISKKVLEEQKATTLQEALRNTPGITLQLGEGGNSNSKDAIQMRGFSAQSSLYKDGIRDVANSVKDTFNTEAVEITKGTVGSDNGRSTHSGYINQVTKSAKNVDSAELTAGYSSAKNLRLTADLNKKIDETVGLRLNVMKQNGDVAGRDGVEQDRKGIAASLGFGIGTETRTTINYEKIRQDDTPDGGVPTVGLSGYYNADLETANITAPKVDSENYYGSDSDFEKSDSDIFSINFEHDISSTTTVSNITKFSKVKQEMVITAPNAVTLTDINDSSSWTVSRTRQQKWEENELFTNQTNFNSKFETGFVGHSLSTGFDYTKESKTTKGFMSAGSMDAANLYSPNSSDTVSGLNLSLNPDHNYTGEIKTLGAYVFDNMSITDNFMIVGGARVERYDLTTKGSSYRNRGGTITITPIDLEDEGTLRSWKLGLVYKPKENGSIYISYADSQLPPGGETLSLSTSDTSSNNPSRDPQKSKTAEVGTKWDFFDNKLSFTGAIYKTNVENETMTEDDGLTISQNGEKEVKGIELGLVGEITDKLSISAGISKTKTEVLNATTTDPSRTSEGAVLRFTPEWNATLWSTYKITPNFILGAGARYVDEQFVSTRASAQGATSTYALSKIDSYVIFDAMASYKIDKNSSLQLNVYNLADKEYISNINNNSRRYTPGSPRTALLTYSYKF